MKKSLLLFGSLLSIAGIANAQHRLTLYEEFSGENCAPCAAQNPGLWSALSAPGNDTNVLLIKYQSPIPSAGPIYYQNTTFTDARMDYYGTSYAPQGFVNGDHDTTVGYFSSVQQQYVDAATAAGSPFYISISNPTYNADGQTFTATVTLTSSKDTTYGNNLKLRFALAEELDYATAPGTNGETTFHNVVRQMYPNADGQSIQSAWTNGESHTYTITGTIPSYVDPSSVHRFFVGFVQNDADKIVVQAGKTDNITIQLPGSDVASLSLSGLSGLECSVPADLNPVVKIKNTGANALTSATIYYKVGSTSSWSSYNWTGNLASGDSTDVNMPTVTLSTAGGAAYYDSVALPNNIADANEYDNVSGKSIYVLSGSAQDIPLTYDFESENSNFVSWPGTSVYAYPIYRVSATSSNIGYNNSSYVAYYPNYSLPAGYQGYYIFPKLTLPDGAKALDFYRAYAQYVNGATTYGDKLEVVYSTDCGETWTSIWNKSGEALATATGTSASYIPAQSDWKITSVDISSVPSGAYLAFRATSGYGNNLFIDNINVRAGETTGIQDLVTDNSFKVYPNPTTGTLNVQFDLKSNSALTYSVYNMVGQKVLDDESVNAASGKVSKTINAGSLAAGVYYIYVRTEAGVLTQKFTKQ